MMLTFVLHRSVENSEAGMATPSKKSELQVFAIE